MMKYSYLLLALMLTALCGVSCREDETAASEQFTLSMDVTLPLEREGLTRAAGDPGIAEFFERPRYLSLFLAVGEPTTPSANQVYFFNIPCSQSDWKRSADSLVFVGRFSQIISWDPEVSITPSTSMRAYMVASFDAYTTEPIVQVNNYHKVTNTGFTESALIDMQFYASSALGGYTGFSLRDIYSTPYNLSETRFNVVPADNRTGYYGTVKQVVGSGTAGIISITDTLYHTAAKVDFQWNTATASQENVMVSATVDNAQTRGYLFRTAETIPGVPTYSKVLLRGGNVTADDMNQGHAARYADAEEVSVGSQWSGRAYTYVLQPGDLSFTVTTSEGGATSATVQRPQSNGNTNDIFAAWYKLPFNIRAAQ
jgi:hypothetical protein